MRISDCSSDVCSSDLDWRRNDPRYSDENLPANLRIVEAIGAVAAKHDVSNAQVALAWLLAQGPDIVPIPGTKRRATMEDSVAAADITLTADDRSDEHTSELQSLMRISYAVFCLKKKKIKLT